MPRRSLLKALSAVVLVLGLLGSAVYPAFGQGDEAATVVAEPESEPLYGWLQISAVTCAGGGEPGMVSILLAIEYAPPGDCVDGASALLIDGIDYGPIAPYLELQLEAGIHTLYEPNTGAARDIEIVANTATGVVVLTVAAAPEPTVEPTAEPAVEAVSETIGSLLIVAHACKPDIQSVDQLYALTDLLSRSNACPAFTLPGYPAPAGVVSGGERSYDFTLTPAIGEAQTLGGNGAFVSDYFCESVVGALDNDPTNDRCVSTSGFAFQVPDGPSTLTQTWIPDTMRYVAAETGSGADAGIITGSDPGSGYLGLDTSLRGTEQPVVHLFYLNPPRVGIVMHLCGPEIATPDQLAALGSLAAQLLTCPATARAYEGGPVDFGISVSDANWGARGLDAAWFDPALICESDIGDWDGDGSNNVCLDAPTYRFDQTAMGYVTVSMDVPPTGYYVGGASSADTGVIAAVDLATGVVTLDTSYDGDVTVHLFGLIALPAATDTPTTTPTYTSTATATATLTYTATATATATSTPVSPVVTLTPGSSTATSTPTRTATPASPTGTATASTQTPASTVPTITPTSPPATGNGTLIVAALYCLSGSGSTVVALAPGEQASAADLGGPSCFSGDASITLTLADGSTIPALKLGRDGVESIQNIPATTSAPHTIREGLGGASATFDIAPGTVTRVIVRYGAGTAMVDEGVISTGGKPGSTTNSAPGGTTSAGGLVTDELVGDAGVSSTAGSYAGISFTSLTIENTDAQAVSSVKDAKSLPGVGVFPFHRMRDYLAQIAMVALLVFVTAAAARRSIARGS